MSSEEVTEEESEASEEEKSAEERSTESSEVRERLDAGRERAVEGFDEGVIDLLSWVLDTETRAKIYIHLRKHPDSTSDEVAEGTGLYPSTVREALAELHEEGTLERGKRESDGAGNNPYEYRAIPPSALVRGAVGEVQDSLNAVFQLDRYVGGEETSDEEPVTITVEDADATEADDVDHSDATVDENLADEDEEAVEDGEDAEDETDGGDGDEERDEDIEESL